MPDLANGSEVPERQNRSNGGRAKDDPEDPVPADEQDQRDHDEASCHETRATHQLLAGAPPRRQAQSGVRSAASFAFSSGDIGSLTATRT